MRTLLSIAAFVAGSALCGCTPDYVRDFDSGFHPARGAQRVEGWLVEPRGNIQSPVLPHANPAFSSVNVHP